jgi:hypothetical protein
MAHTRNWDEADPADSDLVKFGAQEIRDLKVDVRERMALEHHHGDADNHTGMHMWKLVEKSTAYTITNEDHVLIVNTASGDVTLTLPPVLGLAGKPYIIYNIGGNKVIVDGDGTETVGGATTQTLAMQWDVLHIICDETNVDWRMLVPRQAHRLIDQVVDLTDDVTIATDASLGGVFRVTLAGNRTLGAPTNPTPGQKAVWRLKQDATGSRTITLTTGAGGFRLGLEISAITLSTAANTVDYIGAIYDVTDDRWDVVGLARGYV